MPLARASCRRQLSAVLLLLAALGPACHATQAGDLEPRYVAIHNTLAALGLAQVGPLQQGSLAEGRETRLRVEVLAQCTTIVTIGGPGVRDLDVALLDPDDMPVAHDTTREPQATLRVCPASAGHYSLIVKMSAGSGDFMAASWAGGSLGSVAPSVSASTGSTEGTGSCESPFLLAPGVTSGNTRRGEAENAGTCASSDSKELVYKLEITHRQRVTIDVDGQFDSVLYVRKDACAEADADAEVACNDDAGPAQQGKTHASGRGSRIDEVLDPGTYFVFVDGYGTEAGAFQMNVRLTDVPALADACRQVRPLASSKIAASFTDDFDHAHASCGDDAKGPDALYRLDLASRARVRITEHAADFSPALHLRSECALERSEIGCADSGLKPDEATWAGVLDAGSYTLFADSTERGARGRYTLETETAPEAGTGVRGEACGDALTLTGSDRNVEGDTFLARDDVGGTCGGQDAPDVVYRFELARRSRVTARFNKEESRHTFVLTRSCADRASEIACTPNVDENLSPGVYYLAVDGSAAAMLGRFSFAFLARDVSAQDSACRTPPRLVDGHTVSGTTVNAGDKFSTSCGGREDVQASPDRVYMLTLGAPSRIKLVLTTPTWDGVLAIRKSCVDPARPATSRTNEPACNNDFQDTRHAKIEMSLDAGTYFVVVDGHGAKNEGAYTLEYRVTK